MVEIGERVITSKRYLLVMGVHERLWEHAGGAHVNLAGGVSGKTSHLHGVLKEGQELAMLGVNREEGEGISRYRSSKRQKLQK